MGGVSQETTDQEFRDYFAQFGRVVDATLMMDKDTGRPRGFGFVTFESEAGVEACINVPLEIHGKPVEVKKAQPRGNVREEEAARRNKFRKGDDQLAQDGAMAMGQHMGSGGMTPQVMAQYFQRMQQYFAMMQSQMAMNRGMHMNPAMWQNMMQMLQQQPGGAGFQQQPPTGPAGGRCGGGGRGGAGGYGGSPTSWEGMYDDVPQPNAGFRRGGGGGGGVQSSPDPQNAPPANAPTGPKNAGRPGANYRGGGRGGSRGFHPYAR